MHTLGNESRRVTALHVLRSASHGGTGSCKGREIGRLLGPAEWDSEDAKRLIRAFLN